MARILIIDDEPSVRRMLRQMLENAGHEVVEAENGRSGLDVFRDRPPDLVMTDIIMPQKEGIQTIAEMRHEAPQVPVIAMSGGGRTRNLDFLKLAEKVGAHSTIAKPFRMADVLKAVTDALQPPPSGS